MAQAEKLFSGYHSVAGPDLSEPWRNKYDYRSVESISPLIKEEVFGGCVANIEQLFSEYSEYGVPRPAELMDRLLVLDAKNYQAIHNQVRGANNPALGFCLPDSRVAVISKHDLRDIAKKNNLDFTKLMQVKGAYQLLHSLDFSE